MYFDVDYGDEDVNSSLDSVLCNAALILISSGLEDNAHCYNWGHLDLEKLRRAVNDPVVVSCAVEMMRGQLVDAINAALNDIEAREAEMCEVRKLHGEICSDEEVD